MKKYAFDDRFMKRLEQLGEQARESGISSTVWMINSTKAGGGVAEMMPNLLWIFDHIGMDVKWEVIVTENARFFDLTKRLHNSIHGAGCTEYTEEDKEVYEQVNNENFDRLSAMVKPNDIVVIHDPQPLPLGKLFAERGDVRLLWRCHIGLDVDTENTEAAWDFMKPYFEPFEKTIFSVPEYIPEFLKDKSEILYPAICPESDKNMKLCDQTTEDVLCKVHFDPKCKYLLQVSRWDRLKGWKELVVAFGEAKELYEEEMEEWHFVMAGPDPSAIADDPEGLECFEEIKKIVEDAGCEKIHLLSLPMRTRCENAMLVNSLQRRAAVIAQNSVREGFGLTVTEAMWKGKPVLGSCAVGVRTQVRDGVDGILSKPEHLAANIKRICCDTDHEKVGSCAKERAFDNFLIFSQVERYIKLLG